MVSEYIPPRARTVFCAGYQDRLCEPYFRGYDSNDPARLADVMDAKTKGAPASGG